MELKDLMAAFCAKVSLEPIAPDENGVYALSADETDFSVVASDERGERALVVATVGSKPQNASGRTAEILLGLNYLFSATKGATVAYNPVTEQYVLQRELPIAGFSVDDFVLALDTVVGTASELQNLLRTAGGVLAETDGPLTDEDGADDGDGSPFSHNYI